MVTAGAIRHAKLQSKYHHQQPAFYRPESLPVAQPTVSEHRVEQKALFVEVTQLLTGRMPFLSPNQRCRSKKALFVEIIMVSTDWRFFRKQAAERQDDGAGKSSDQQRASSTSSAQRRRRQREPEPGPGRARQSAAGAVQQLAGQDQPGHARLRRHRRSGDHGRRQQDSVDERLVREQPERLRHRGPGPIPGSEHLGVEGGLEDGGAPSSSVDPCWKLGVAYDYDSTAIPGSSAILPHGLRILDCCTAV